MEAQSKSRECPYCKEEVKADAIKCRYCESCLTPERPSHGGTCPYCKEQIKADAIKCRYCTSDLRPGMGSGCGYPQGATMFEIPWSAGRGSSSMAQSGIGGMSGQIMMKSLTTSPGTEPIAMSGLTTSPGTEPIVMSGLGTSPGIGPIGMTGMTGMSGMAGMSGMGCVSCMGGMAGMSGMAGIAAAARAAGVIIRPGDIIIIVGPGGPCRRVLVPCVVCTPLGCGSALCSVVVCGPEGPIIV